MNKVILIMDDPMFCCNCPLAKNKKHNITKEERWYCGIGHQGEYSFVWVYEPIDMDSETKPDWCPLRTVPEKEYADTGIMEVDEFAAGWNACIDEILRGNNNDK